MYFLQVIWLSLSETCLDMPPMQVFQVFLLDQLIHLLVKIMYFTVSICFCVTCTFPLVRVPHGTRTRGTCVTRRYLGLAQKGSHKTRSFIVIISDVIGQRLVSRSLGLTTRARSNMVVNDHNFDILQYIFL